MKKAAAISDALFVVGAQNLAGIRIDKMDLRAGEAAAGRSKGSEKEKPACATCPRQKS
jgi:hypothetical protein